MALKNTRLWKNQLAAPYVSDGDPNVCSTWIGWATSKLQQQLRSAGALSCTYNPAPDVWIRVDTRPNKITIKAGTPMKPMIQGLISNSIGQFDWADAFVVYDGSKPDTYLNPTQLTEGVVEAKSIEDWDGDDPNTFLRIKELAPGDYAGFYGYADWYNRVYKLALLPSVYRGLIEFRKKKVYADLPCLYDVEFIGGKLHVLNGAVPGTTSAPSSYELIYATITLGGTVANVKKFTITRTEQKANPHAQHGFKVSIFDYAASTTVEIFSKTHAQLGTPVNATDTTFFNNAGVFVLDARFSPDKTKICILSGLLNSVWDMAIPDPQLGTSTNQFHSILDLVLYRTTDKNILLAEVVDPYIGCTEDTPVVGRLYPLEHSTFKRKHSLTITTHEDLYDAKVGGFTYGFINGTNAVTEVYDGSAGVNVPHVYMGDEVSPGVTQWFTDDTNLNSLCDPLDPPFNGTTGALWLGDSWAEWQAATSDDPASDVFYQIGGLVKREAILYYEDFFTGELKSVSFTAERLISRAAMWTETFDASGVITHEFNGVWKYGYWFDTDKESLTYNSRKFFEVGYKLETGNALNGVSSLEATYTIANSSRNIRSIVGGAGILSKDSSWTCEVTKGGAMCQTIYLDDTPIQRVNYIRALQQGQKHTITYTSSEIVPGDGSIPLELDRNRNYIETVTGRPIAQLKAEEYDLQSSVSARYTMRDIPLMSGGINTDHRTGQYAVYQDDGAYPTGTQYVDPLTDYIYHDHIEYPYYKNVSTHVQAAMMNGAEHTITSKVFKESTQTKRSTAGDTGINGLAETIVTSGTTYPVDAYISFWELLQTVPYEYGPVSTTGGTVLAQVRDFKTATYYVEGYDSFWTNYLWTATLPITTTVNGQEQTYYVSSYDVRGTILDADAFATINKAGVAVLDSNGNVLANNLTFPNGSNPTVDDPASNKWLTVLGYRLKW